MEISGNYALITGASSGIGKEIAILLAARGYHLLLVSRNAETLESVSAEIIKLHSVAVHYLPADLSLPGASAQVAGWCTGITNSLSVLINNAGYGVWGNFEQLPLSDQQNMLQLNINAVVELTYSLLPLLRKADRAYVLNVASTAAYQALPTLAVYAATKTFVLSFSRALRYELKDTSISVSCLSPGPTATGFADRAGMAALAELAEKFNMQPAQVAAIGLKGLFNKKAEIIPGFLNQLSAWGARHLPKALIENISAGLYKTK